MTHWQLKAFEHKILIVSHTQKRKEATDLSTTISDILHFSLKVWIEL